MNLLAASCVILGTVLLVQTVQSLDSDTRAASSLYRHKRNEQGGCASGWRFYNGSCYKYFENGLPWSNANYYCNQQFTAGNTPNLATVNNEAENQFIAENFNANKQDHTGDIWIGLRRSNGAFVWASSSGATYRKWNTNQPNSNSNACVKMDMVNDSIERISYWATVNCNNPHPFVCEYKAPTQSPSTVAPSTTTTASPTETTTVAVTTTAAPTTEPPASTTTTTSAPTEPSTEAPTTTTAAPTTVAPTTTTETPITTTEAPTTTTTTSAPTEPSTAAPTTTEPATTTTTTSAPTTTAPPTTEVSTPLPTGGIQPCCQLGGKFHKNMVKTGASLGFFEYESPEACCQACSEYAGCNMWFHSSEYGCQFGKISNCINPDIPLEDSGLICETC